MPSKKYSRLGSLWISIAALCWATDAVFRFPSVHSISPVSLVLGEHFIATLLLIPWVFIQYKKKIFSLNSIAWVSVGFAGIFGSALATLLFTSSFKYVNPSVSILLQKVQPVVVVILAFLFLKERPSKTFFAWTPFALLAAVGVSFPDLNFKFLREGLDLHSKGVFYALSASFIWAITTVVGRLLTHHTDFLLATFWRYVFGLFTLAILFLISGTTFDSSLLQNHSALTSLFYMALIPGLIAMLCYYKGLTSTPASTATFLELIFPVSAVIINAVFLGLKLNPIQVIAGGCLLYAVSQINRVGSKN